MRKEEYTKQQLLEAMLALLDEKRIEDISITELVNKAHVGRASFYRNYSQKEDILISHIKNLFEQWGEDFEKEGNPDVNAALLKHFWNEREFYQAVYNANLGFHIYNSMKNAMNISKKTNPIEKYLTSWYAGSIYGFIDEWIKSGMRESPDELMLLMKNLMPQ